MDHGDPYKLETNSDSQTSISSTTDVTFMSNINNPFTNTNLQTPINHNNKKPSNTPMDTLYERSNDDDCIVRNEFDDTICSELNETTSSKRKRKLTISCNNSFLSKRRRELYYSEQSKRKFSDIFRTPMQYFANRRKTINDLNDTSINESVASTSGLFEVETVQNLSELTPNNKKIIDAKRIRKKLFTRSFNRTSRKGLNLNKLSSTNGNNEAEYNRLNVSCFPEISSLSIKSNDYCETRNNNGNLDNGEQPVNNSVVLTSFHSLFLFLCKGCKEIVFLRLHKCLISARNCLIQTCKSRLSL